MNPSQLQNHFDAFYEDFWCEMCKYGEPEEVVVCDNNNDRMFLYLCLLLLLPPFLLPDFSTDNLIKCAIHTKSLSLS